VSYEVRIPAEHVDPEPLSYADDEVVEAMQRQARAAETHR